MRKDHINQINSIFARLAAAFSNLAFKVQEATEALQDFGRAMLPETCPHAKNTAARAAWYMDKYGKAGLDRLVVDDSREEQHDTATR